MCTCLHHTTSRTVVLKKHVTAPSESRCTETGTASHTFTTHSFPRNQSSPLCVTFDSLPPLNFCCNGALIAGAATPLAHVNRICVQIAPCSVRPSLMPTLPARLPRQVFGRFHAACAYVRMIYLALAILLFSSATILFCDQVRVVECRAMLCAMCAMCCIFAQSDVSCRAWSS